VEKAKIIRKRETKNFMEGNEYCKLHIENGNIVFGVSILPPGMKGGVDLGHQNAYEVFFVAKGRVLCNLPDENLYEELEEGDAILIPPPRPHALMNIGSDTATVVWSQARRGGST
jgi:quercetin dioxygenase-like cupin family protein